GWGSARGTLYRDGKPPEALDAMGLVREEGVVIWNPQLFSAGDTVVFGDPFIYYFYGKELCRRYKPDRLDLRLHSRLNRRAKDYKVLDIQDFCRVDPSYNPFWRNPWILAPPL
ncbi:MAG: hypothetical protein HY554_08960, partial [Elusimicrobia bacterium]|nr:hypothetical protein [Elusimicrobiota bacterium]